MPHATDALPNGTTSQSQFLDHLTSYPVVSDGIETFKSNPYGKKSLEIAGDAYERFGKPVEPYFETPKQYAAPYAKKADELANSGLSQIDNHFPIVKEDTNTIVDKGKALVWYPFALVGEGKDYVLSTYNDEYKKTASHKNRGSGFSTLILAIISTELKIASDFFQAIADFLGPKYDEGLKSVHDIARKVEAEADKYTKEGQEKLKEAQNVGNEKKEQAKEEAQKTKEEAQKKVQK